MSFICAETRQGRREYLSKNGWILADTSKKILRCTNKAFVIKRKRHFNKVKCNWFNEIKEMPKMQVLNGERRLLPS
jgi:hypothetical protein